MPLPRRSSVAVLLLALLALLMTTMYLRQAGEIPLPTRPQTSTAAQQIARAPTASAEERRSTTAKDITFDNIKLDMKKGDPYESSLLTPEIKKLDGKHIRLRGYILPSFQQSGIKQFVLVRDNMECCFGPGAAIYDCVLVEMVDNATTEFTVSPVAVEGTFTISELKDPDGKHVAIYHIDGRTVK